MKKLHNNNALQSILNVNLKTVSTPQIHLFIQMSEWNCPK